MGKWRSGLFLLNDFSVRRRFQPENFGELKSVDLHHFSDASTSGYGQCSYLRLVDEEDNVHSSLVMGKARVSPLKTVTLPCLELTAALVSVKVSHMVHKELNYKEILDSEGLLRVGGRMPRKRIMPRKRHITSLIICYYHHRVNHQGRGIQGRRNRGGQGGQGPPNFKNHTKSALFL